MAYSWAKVYIEVLDDHKMGLLPDSLWRRVIEMILLAKKLDKDGWLPGLMEMSWTLRMPAEKLEADLIEIRDRTKTDDLPGIVELKDGNWFLTNFAKRQSFEPVAERVKNYRKRNVSEPCNDDVTKGYTDKTRLDTDTDKETPRKRDPIFDAICSVCSIDPKVKGNGAKIGKARAALSDSEPPYSANEILAFGTWWNSDDWRRKKGPPTIWKLTEQIGIVRNGNGKETSNGTGRTSGPTIGADETTEQREHNRQIQIAIDKKATERAERVKAATGRRV